MEPTSPKRQSQQAHFRQSSCQYLSSAFRRYRSLIFRLQPAQPFGLVSGWTESICIPKGRQEQKRELGLQERIRRCPKTSTKLNSSDRLFQGVSDVLFEGHTDIELNFGNKRVSNFVKSLLNHLRSHTYRVVKQRIHVAPGKLILYMYTRRS